MRHARGRAAERRAYAFEELGSYGEVVVASAGRQRIGARGTIGRLKAEMDKRGIRALVATDTRPRPAEGGALHPREVKTPGSVLMLRRTSRISSFNVKNSTAR